MTVSKKFWMGLAGLNGFMAIVMGAVAAHALTDPHDVSLAEKASAYQLVHAVLLVALAHRTEKYAGAARWAFLVGIALFCGTLYVRALSGWAAATNLAPAGGICLMAGWLLITLAAYKGE